MNKLTDARRVAIVRALCERQLRQGHGPPYRHGKGDGPVEADEIWSFVGAKAVNATQDGHSDIWTFAAMCAESKLTMSWLVGPRTAPSTREFMQDLAPRLADRVQLTTDAFPGNPVAVEEAFGWNCCDYAQVKKEFGTTHDGPTGGRYSPSPVAISTEKIWVMGSPDDAKVSTPYVERSNPTIRMSNRRFTRLTNAFSKNAENHAHAVSLMFFF